MSETILPLLPLHFPFLAPFLTRFSSSTFPFKILLGYVFLLGYLPFFPVFFAPRMYNASGREHTFFSLLPPVFPFHAVPIFSQGFPPEYFRRPLSEDHVYTPSWTSHLSFPAFCFFCAMFCSPAVLETNFFCVFFRLLEKSCGTSSFFFSSLRAFFPEGTSLPLLVYCEEELEAVARPHTFFLSFPPPLLSRLRLVILICLNVIPMLRKVSLEPGPTDVSFFSSPWFFS